MTGNLPRISHILDYLSNVSHVPGPSDGGDHISYKFRDSFRFFIYSLRENGRDVERMENGEMIVVFPT